MPRLQELVVRRAGDDLDLQLRNGFVVDDAAQRARRKHIRVAREDLIRRHSDGAKFFDQPIDLCRIDVRDEQTRAGPVQMRRQVIADIAASL